MAASETHLINITFLENRLGELDLKHWWVAEYIGVDRKTLSRWLSGKVKTIKGENLKALASCLNCEPNDLVLKDDSAVIASKAEQSLAAELIVQENLLATLTPLGQWPLLESVVKATMQPNLPLPTMGKLYNLLSICSWRQSEMDKALGFANKALAIGCEIGHRGVLAQAKNNLAVIASYQGRLIESIALYESVISERRFLDDERAVAAALSNLAQDYHIYGDFEKSRRIQGEAIDLYTKLDLKLNLSIAFCALGLLETEVGNLTKGEVALKEALHFASIGGYLRGQSAFKIYLADVYSRRGEFEHAQEMLQLGFEGMGNLSLDEALSFEVRGRFYRLQKRFDEALVDLSEGLRLAEKFPLETASLKVELAELWYDRSDLILAATYREEARKIYEVAGARERVRRQVERFFRP